MEKTRDRQREEVKIPFEGEILTLYVDLVKSVNTGNTGRGTLTSDPHQTGVAKDIEVRIYKKDYGSDEIVLVQTLKAHNRAYAMPNLAKLLADTMLNSGWASHV